jgi:hypothetical protein
MGFHLREARQSQPQGILTSHEVLQPFSLLELPDGRYHLVLIGLTETVVKGQPDQTFAFLFAYWTTPIPPPHALAHGGKVERHIMKYAENAARL